jgi:chromosome segregation ATPase
VAQHARLKDHDAFLKREAQLRLAAEKAAEEAHNQSETLNLELMQTKHRLAAAEASLSRLEDLHAHKSAAHESAMSEVLKDKAHAIETLERRLGQVEAKLAATESEVRRRDAALARVRDDELRRLAAVEERIMDGVRRELVMVRQEAGGGGEGGGGGSKYGGQPSTPAR